MSRPSKNIDVKLIELGKKRMIQSGISSLSIRSICVDAGINLGMFYYYFKTKENFIKVLFESFNDDLYNYWEIESLGISSSLERLKRALNVGAYLIKEKRGVAENIFKDFDFKNEAYMQTLKGIHNRWQMFYTKLVEDCKKDSFFANDVDNRCIIAMLVGSVKYYANVLEMDGAENYYEKVNAFIDFLIEKLK
ncbi:MAG: TetR/AcrR family transcriptional regulator, partial [Endomicrobium sp.]|nr:TetR/AcrR family transcriptional regulator [Endomicrobium sp.]